MTGRLFGYARVSTDDQDLRLQMQALEKYGVPEMRIYSEHASGKTVNRKAMQRVIRVMRSGDVLVVWKLDRLGRDMMGVYQMVEALHKNGIELVSLTERVDTQSPMGKAFFQIGLVFAELERNMISERTKAGIAAAKAAGSKFGRRPMIWGRDDGSEKRLAYLQGLDDAGELRERVGDVWVLIPKAQDLMDQLNKPSRMGKKDKLINNPETVRRWTREGYMGLDKKEGRSNA